jgi:hypothetical protein
MPSVIRQSNPVPLAGVERFGSHRFYRQASPVRFAMRLFVFIFVDGII